MSRPESGTDRHFETGGSPQTSERQRSSELSDDEELQVPQRRLEHRRRELHEISQTEEKESILQQQQVHQLKELHAVLVQLEGDFFELQYEASRELHDYKGSCFLVVALSLPPRTESVFLTATEHSFTEPSKSQDRIPRLQSLSFLGDMYKNAAFDAQVDQLRHVLEDIKQ